MSELHKKKGVTILSEMKCNDCQDVYPVLRETTLQQLFFCCRRCRLVCFGEAIEQLMQAGPEFFGLSDADVAPYTLQFYASCDELYEAAMDKRMVKDG